MKKQTVVVWGLALVSIVAGGAFAGENLINGKCVKVIDGDTLVIECEKNRKTVEIDGVDAPELQQPWGKEVRSFVRTMVGGEKVEFEVVEQNEDVIRARVFVDGKDLSEILVSRGLAWVPEDGADSELAELGAKARELPCGLWTDADAEPPWEFRAAQS